MDWPSGYERPLGRFVGRDPHNGMATQRDLLAALPASAVDLGQRFWPNATSPVRGGPEGPAIVATFQLGRLRAKGLITQVHGDGPCTQLTWKRTPAGDAELQ